MAKFGKDLIIAQYKNSPKLVSIIESFSDSVQTDLIDSANQIAFEAAVATASGFWLDKIGERVGLARVGIPSVDTLIFGFDGQDDSVGFDQGRLTDAGEDPTYIPVSDDVYRQLLIARGAELITDGSQPDLSRVAAQAYGAATYLDNQDMTVTIILSGVDDEVANIANQAGLLPKPAGVRINQIQVNHPEGAFGFEGQSDAVGFDQAPFVGVL